jgi:ribonuclease HII
MIKSLAKQPNFYFEQEGLKAGFQQICGIDEAGRGPWAGPVVAAAVILDATAYSAGLNDSKKLTEENREALFGAIMATAKVGIGLVEAAVIDEINILQATYRAMGQALAGLNIQPDLALVDGNRAPPLPCSVKTIIAGDGLSLSIAAASIIAKVTRDRLMVALDQTYPQYGFARHKGYGTAQHAAALAQFGPCPAHRMSFKPIVAMRHR